MVEFDVPLTATQLFPAVFCSGILFLGLLLYIVMYINSKDRLHLSMIIMGGAGFVFVLGEALILSCGWTYNPNLGMQFHRMEQSAATVLIFGMPFMLHNLIEMTPAWKKASKYICYVTFFISLIIVIAAFIMPDLFISVEIHRADWLMRQADYGRGKEGPLYMVRDGLLGLLIIYMLTSFLTDMFRHKHLRYLMLAFIGLLIAVTGAVIDVMSVYTGKFYDLTPDSRYSRFVVGMTVFILFSMWAVLRKFFDISKESERIKSLAIIQSEKNSRQNDFIQKTLKSNSEDLFKFSGALLNTISDFTTNTQNQAAATEQVTASIEEISAGTETVKSNIDRQFQRIGELFEIMKSAANKMEEMVALTKDTLNKMGDISTNARSGEESLNVMSESMKKIGKSSGEITGIIEIINDISDQINLLSLNASIEAARAGDSGRGFAVVADEISKLADQTASSIKNIGELILNNDREIKTGSQKISAAVITINNIIHDIEVIVGRISDISDSVNKQAEENNKAAVNTETVRNLSEQVMMSMDEQKTAMIEITKTVGAINEIAQVNTSASIDITETAKSLVEKVSNINREIEEFNM